MTVLFKRSTNILFVVGIVGGLAVLLYLYLFLSAGNSMSQSLPLMSPVPLSASSNEGHVEILTVDSSPKKLSEEVLKPPPKLQQAVDSKPHKISTTQEIPTNSSSIKRKNFVYLTQTESCIPSYLKRPDILGDPANCDVLVLSFKKECNNKSLPHVKYIFGSHTAWASGRNMLYETIKKREQKYLFYIFIEGQPHSW